MKNILLFMIAMSWIFDVHSMQQNTNAFETRASFKDCGMQAMSYDSSDEDTPLALSRKKGGFSDDDYGYHCEATFSDDEVATDFAGCFVSPSTIVATGSLASSKLYSIASLQTSITSESENFARLMEVINILSEHPNKREREAALEVLSAISELLLAEAERHFEGSLIK